MCYMLAAGKKATADGSVMVARSCDANSTETQQIFSVPRKKHTRGSMLRIPDSNNLVLAQVEETYAYTAVQRFTPGNDLYLVSGGINEFQVSVGASTGGWVKPEVEALTPWPDTVVGDYVMTLALERCKTAREAVLWLGDITEKYGARTDNYIVSDMHEAWLFEQYQGYHWAAARVPDDCFVVEANSFRLAEIDPDDPENYLCDPDLIPFAIKHGLWDPNSGQVFHASRAYSTNELNRPRAGHPQPYYSLHRIWRGISMLNANLDLELYEPSKEYPLFVKPDRKLTPADFLEVMKDDYSGTELDEYHAQNEDYPTVVNPVTGHYRLAPVWGKSRIIGCPQTVTSWVVQSRDWLPNGIGGLLWAGLAASWASPHLPFYACNTRTPAAFQKGYAGKASAYDKDSAYWKFEVITNLVTLFYQGTQDLVKPVWKAFEDQLFSQQNVVEETALGLHKEAPELAAEYLTTTSFANAQLALARAEEMIAELHFRIASLNNPQTSRAYEDPRTWDLNDRVY
ncbi:MAG: C69 family dipeptidase [Anaerolineaceae bacterium]|nr:C69 family dipeptidase [Anaerolineaceae bacterium]